MRYDDALEPRQERPPTSARSPRREVAEEGDAREEDIREDGIWARDHKASDAGKLEGNTPDPFFIVLCSTHCRVEDITDEGTWARSLKTQERGQTIERNKGEPIPNIVMRAWLEPRREDPELSEQGVGIWGQELGYEDSLICSWMSQLAHPAADE